MNRNAWRRSTTPRALRAAALAMPLVALAATPSFAEGAPSPSATTIVRSQTESPGPGSALLAPVQETPGTTTSPSPGSEAPVPAPVVSPEPATPTATEPSVTPTPTPSESASTPAATPTAAPVVPAEAQPVEVSNAAFAAALQQRIINEPAFRKQFIALVQQRINNEPAFRAAFVADVQRRIATEPFFALTWRAGMRAATNSNFNVGATTWTGGSIRHPRGIAFYSSVTRWGELVLGVMNELNIDPYYFPGIMAQLQQESGGNPTATNGWDSNAWAGYASMGLLQVIAPTYRAYAKPGYQGNLIYTTIPGTSVRQQFASPWQTYPYTNLYAALNYVIDRYGYSKFKSWKGLLHE